MLLRTLIVACLTLVLPVPILRADPSPGVSDTLPDILRSLTDRKYAARETAQRDLEKIPADRILDLSNLAETQTDPEIKERLQQRVYGMAIEMLRVQLSKPTAATGHLSGRVVDSSNRPIPDANLCLTTLAMGVQLSRGLGAVAKTNAAGDYDIPLPAGEIIYQLSIGSPGYRSIDRTIPPLTSVVPDITLVAAKVLAPSGGTLLDQNADPVANVKVTFTDQYGTNATTVVTGPDGAFLLDRPTGAFRTSVLTARLGNAVLPLRELRTPFQRQKFQLVPAATLKGIIRDGTSARPLAGIAVTARPNFSSWPLFETRTASDGTYVFTDMPPGRYIVTAESAEFFRRPPQNDFNQIPLTTLAAGETGSADLDMQRCAIIYGQVLTNEKRPIRGAFVGVPSSWDGDYSRNQTRVVRTNDDGVFAISTCHTDEQFTLSVSSPEHGFFEEKVKPIPAGSCRKTSVVLNGAFHLKGIISDCQGKPVKDVVCWFYGSGIDLRVTTPADGTFDLGHLPLGPDLTQNMLLLAPRPYRGPEIPSPMLGGISYPISQGEKPPEFYQHKRVPIPHGRGEIVINPQLLPADLIEIVGVLKDVAGVPVPNAEAYLFMSDIKPDDFVEPLPRSSLNSPPARDKFAIGFTRTDAAGHWHFWAVRETGVGVFPGDEKTDWNSGALGFITPGNQTLFIPQVTYPTTNVPCEVKTQLIEQPPKIQALEKTTTK